jgi:hypothetical protein
LSWSGVFLRRFQDSSQKSGNHGNHAFIEASEKEDPAGGFEVVTTPPLGKCSINVKDDLKICPSAKWPKHNGKAVDLSMTLFDLSFQ